MSIFDNYINQDDNYIPDNIHDKKICLAESSFEYGNLHPWFDLKHHQIGYQWEYGLSNILSFTVNKVINVPEDAIIFYNQSEYPDITTEGKIGQKAYNTINILSWTCTSIESVNDEFKYIWTPDEHLTYNKRWPKQILLTPDMSEKMIVVNFYNWQNTLIFTRLQEGENNITINITSDLSSDYFLRGLYKCEVQIVGEEEIETTDIIQIRVV